MGKIDWFEMTDWLLLETGTEKEEPFLSHACAAQV